MAGLELGDIQGNILRAYRELQAALYLFIGVDDVEAGRRWLAGMTGRVTTARAQAATELRLTCNLAFTAAGLRALGVPPEVMSRFSLPFREGMAARAGCHLGDRDLSAPGEWERGLGRGQAHVLAVVHGWSRDLVRDEGRRLGEELAAAGLSVVHDQEVHRLPGGVEHFGFSDGIAQPVIAGAEAARAPGRPAPRSTRWRPLPPGEFLLGHRDLDGLVAPGPPWQLGVNGTYMVYRKLAQDVPGFRNYVRQQAEAWDVPEDLVRAKIVGRWPDGTPLVLSPEAPNPELRQKPENDDFGYAGDPGGFRCPLGAHIRRCHPRDGLGFGERLSERHRMIRRGMPYGPPLREEGTGEGKRGLIFVCLVSDLERQFEFLQSKWCNDGNPFGLGTDGDALIGQGTPAKMTVPGRPPRFLPERRPFITTRGGEYLFMPGLRALRAIAAGATGDGES